MRLNAEFDQIAVIAPEDHEWVESPTPGVTRMMLDRVGGEVARATSLVRYSPDSRFPAHEHGGGEEILVLEGEFADEHGVYAAGSYLRNPVGTRHAPRVDAQGALIFVKLHQFDPEDRRQVRLDTRSPAWLGGLVPGLKVMPLHEYGAESVALVAWPPGLALQPRCYPGGAEWLVLEGGFADERGTYAAGTWLRHPPGSCHSPRTGESGALLYRKTGHLASLVGS